MSRRSLSCIAAVTLVLASLTRPAGADADEGDVRVIVMSFEGPTGKSVRNQVIKKLASTEGVDLISRKKAAEAGKSLGIPADTSKPKNLVKIGELLGIDAMVTGTVFSEKKIKNLELTVIFTQDPSMSFTKNYTWKGKLPGSDLINEIAADLSIGVSDTVKIIKDEQAYKAYQQAQQQQQPTTAPPKKKKKKKKRPPKGDRGPVISIHAGLLMSARKLKITRASGPNIEYDGSIFPGIGIDLAFFPIRLATSSAASGLGLTVGFRHSLSLESRMQGAVETFKTYYRLLDLKLTYQLILDNAPLALDFGAGWGFLYYQLNVPSTIPDPPVMDYEYMNILIGIAAAIAAKDPWFTITVGADLRIPVAFGEAKDAYGVDASGFGGTFKLGLSGIIAGGFGWSAGFEYTGMSTKHKPVNNKSADHYISGRAMLGYTW